MRRWMLVAIVPTIAALLLAASRYRQAVGDPAVRRMAFVHPALSSDTPSIRLVLVSDLHVAAPVTSRARLIRIVAQVNTCGIVHEGVRTLVVTARLGTSLLPIRIGAPPDLRVIYVRGSAAAPPPDRTVKGS